MVDVRTSAPVVGIPPIIGKYHIIGQLGRGGMADLYLAVTAGIGGFSKLHVLKLIRTDSFGNADAVQMFVTEARVTALLNHPNLVQTHEVGEDSGLVFMVMEYLDGQSLDLILARSQSTSAGFDIGMRLRTLSEILNGLHHAHELCDLEGSPLGLVHRDVSPHNIFVTYDGGIKLLDFGVAKTTSANSPTRVGTIKGKLAYMAPEQVSNPGQVTRAADIFQVGLILWEGVIGNGVWQGLTEYEVLMKLSNSSGLPLHPPSDADPDLVEICRRATAWNPEERYPTAEAFNRDIETYMARRNLSVSAKQVGAYLASLFAQRRAEVREAIGRRLKSLQSDPPQSDDNFDEVTTPLIPEIVTGRPRTRSGQSSSSGTAPLVGTLPSETSGRGHVNKQKKMLFPILVVIAGVAASALAGGLVARNAGQRAHGKIPAPIAAPLMPSATKAEEVELVLETEPATAQLFLDGRSLLANPFVGRVSKDGSLHVVRAEAQGYESSSFTIQFDGDKKRVVRLSPISGPDPAAGAARALGSKKAQSALSHRPVRRISNSKEGPSAVRAPDKDEVSPSVRLDNSDPWK